MENASVAMTPGSGNQETYLSTSAFKQEANKSTPGFPYRVHSNSKTSVSSFHSSSSLNFRDLPSATWFKEPGRNFAVIQILLSIHHPKTLLRDHCRTLTFSPKVVYVSYSCCVVWFYGGMNGALSVQKACKTKNPAFSPRKFIPFLWAKSYSSVFHRPSIWMLPLDAPHPPSKTRGITSNVSRRAARIYFANCPR